MVKTEPAVHLREDPEWHSGIGRRKESGEALLQVLSELPIFNMLTSRELEKLSEIVHRRHFAAGEEVLRPWVPRSGYGWSFARSIFRKSDIL